MACHLAMVLGVELPNDIVFLGEVGYDGNIIHPYQTHVHILDLCVKQGYSRIVGPSEEMTPLHEMITPTSPYSGVIEVILLDDAFELVTKVFPMFPLVSTPDDSEEKGQEKRTLSDQLKRAGTVVGAFLNYQL